MAGDGPVEAPFRRGVLLALVAVGACSLALAIALTIAQPDVEVVSAGADSFSHSALGHSGFVALLRAEGVPVLVSRYASGERAGSHALLLVAEPRLSDRARTARLEAMLGRARVALLVLPKWQAREDPAHPGWVGEARPVPAGDVSALLSAAGVAATVTDAPGPLGSCEGTTAHLGWARPRLLVPSSPEVRPLLSCAGGALLAEVRREGRRVLVLSDPDALANHALGQDDHARLALEIVNRARGEGQAVVLDETLHGHERIPSLWRELFAFPLLPAVLAVALALFFYVWSGLGRFGAPLPVPPPFATGKAVLLDNTAALLRTAGHSAHTLGRYFDAAVADVARALHAPSPAIADLTGWLRGLPRGRRPGADLLAVRKQVENARRADPPSGTAIVAAARRTHRWRQEMLRGPEDRPGR